MFSLGFSRLNPIAATFAIFCPILVLTPLFSYLPLGDDGGSLSSFQKIFVFYKAPMVKFIGNVCSYFVFLLLYAYVAIFNFTWTTQKSELVLYAWIAIFMLDEVREILIQPANKIHRKIAAHFDNVYNTLDGLVFLLAVASGLLKQFAATFMIARAVFAFNAVLLFVRLLRVYHVNINLGPKLVIFYRYICGLNIFHIALFQNGSGAGQLRHLACCLHPRLWARQPGFDQPRSGFVLLIWKVVKRF